MCFPPWVNIFNSTGISISSILLTHSIPRHPSNAGIYATASVISEQRNETAQMQSELDLFYSGFEACKPVHFNKHGSDEVLVGRTGYLSGVYWLNDNLSTKPFQDAQILEICDSILKSGREYSQKNKSPLPLMYQYHGSEYLGAAHGVCAILLVLLQSPLFKGEGTTKEKDIKQSVDAFLGSSRSLLIKSVKE